jgi:hypothetical protein
MSLAKLARRSSREARSLSCNQCGQQLIEIDNRGERLIGCLTCNLWAAAGSG